MRAACRVASPPDSDFFDARHDGFAGGGQLVDAIGSVDDEGAFGAERCQSSAHQQNLAGREYANDLRARAGGVGERADEIEDGPEAERAAQRPQSLHGRVIERREEEDEAGLAQALDGQLGPSSMGTPRASSTSAAPQREVTARLPCLATLAPAAAATSAAPQEMLKVCGPPPPVPTQSTSSSRSDR